MRDHQVPPTRDKYGISCGSLNVKWAIVQRWQQVAGPRIMAALAERFAHNPRKLTRNQDSHFSSLLRSTTGDGQRLRQYFRKHARPLSVVRSSLEAAIIVM